MTLGKIKNEIVSLDLFPWVGHILPANTWLIHFCENPEKIAREGFLFGENAIHRLACTWKDLKPKAHNGPGFNFAFLALDLDGAGTRWDPTLWPSAASCHHEKALLFQAPGIPTSHHDGFEQVIFQGEKANFKKAKILTFIEDEFEGTTIQVHCPNGNLLDDGLSEDFPEETIQKWTENSRKNSTALP